MGLELGPPLDLRKLRYFVAVAEELHFGRAAERLYIAQPVLSRQIRRLEQELGTDLLVRTSRNVMLTPAGLQVLAEAKSLLAAADATRRRIEDVASGEAALTVGFFVGDSFTAALEAFGAQYADVAIDLLRIYWNDQTEALLDGRADVAFVHLPVDDQGLELLPVRSEPRVAVLPVRHPSAGKPEISIADLADDPVIIQRGATPVWQAFHNVDPRPDGRRPRPGPAVDNLEESCNTSRPAGQSASSRPPSPPQLRTPASPTSQSPTSHRSRSAWPGRAGHPRRSSQHSSRPSVTRGDTPGFSRAPTGAPSLADHTPGHHQANALPVQLPRRECHTPARVRASAEGSHTKGPPRTIGDSVGPAKARDRSLH